MWLLSILLYPMAMTQLPITEYFCGVDNVSKWTSFLMTSNCDQSAINRCCLSHDLCYSSCSLPQSACDAQFCQCLFSLPANLFCRNVVLSGHCNLVQWLGHQHICPPMAEPLL